MKQKYFNLQLPIFIYKLENLYITDKARWNWILKVYEENNTSMSLFFNIFNTVQKQL